MIVQETVTINNVEYRHTYSDSNFYILKEETNEKYAEAYDVLEADFTYVETQEQIPIDSENELKLTRGDVFRGLLQAKGITRAQIRGLLEAMPEETQEERLQKELALIDFDEALYFYRRNLLIDRLGLQVGVSKAQMTKFFETNDWHELIS